jgi:hypothetical protein
MPAPTEWSVRELASSGATKANNPAQTPALDAVDQVLSYHERTRHRLERYAAGPETLDWTAQPDPFRVFAGASKLFLPLTADRFTTPYSVLGHAELLEPRPIGVESIGLLLELSLGLGVEAIRTRPLGAPVQPFEWQSAPY